MTTTTKEPTWFTVTRNGSLNSPGKPFQVRTRTMGNLYSASKWHRDYATHAEAVAAGLSNGWVRVKDWKEARALAQPIQDARWTHHEQARAARKGMTAILFTDYVTDKKTRVWVTPERAQQILADLGEPNEYGVIK
jgi:hypothetical protein